MNFSRSGRLYLGLRGIRNHAVIIQKRLKFVDRTAYVHHSSRIAKDLVAAAYVFIGQRCTIEPLVSIGRYTMLAANVAIVGDDHDWAQPAIPMQFSGRPVQRRTLIGADAWIGEGVTVMRGTSIGNGAIIAAGAVVTKDVPAYEIWAGVPAAKLRNRFEDPDAREIHSKMLDGPILKPTFASPQSTVSSSKQPALPRVLIIVGYFDWFSGYQETALAAAFSKVALTEVVTSDRANPGFTSEHLAQVGIHGRKYAAGATIEHGVTVTRFACSELRSMVWSLRALIYIFTKQYDLIIQVMPGQALPIAASLIPSSAPRLVLYGDNREMWSHFGRRKRLVKGAAFALSKGAAYLLVNLRAQRIYGYTQNTLDRLRAFSARRRMELMPLAFEADRFFSDDGLRTETRIKLGFAAEDIVLISAGKLLRAKRLEWAFDAFAEAAKTEPNLRLLLVGADDSPYSREFTTYVGASGLSEKVKIVGFVQSNELNALFNCADIGVWPSRPAITIQQAMGTGLPVLLPENDLVGHLVRDGDETGIYYNLIPGDEVANILTALRSAIKKIDFGTDARRGRVKLNGWFSADAIVGSLLAGQRRIGLSGEV